MHMKKTLVLILLMTFILAACNTSVADPPVETAAPTALPDPTAIPSPTPTETPPVVLTLCTTSLPETLFPYAGAVSAAKTRLADLLFPPAFSEEDGTLTPLILDKVPTQADGDLRLEPVPIRRGQTVVDARGELVTATEGAWVRPSGCREAECAITWNGLDPLEMDQMVIDFTLKDGLEWTDGTPMTPADAVFSYRLASEPDSPAYGWTEARTQSFSAWDARTLSWRGYPGFASSELARFFWAPLPAHRFDSGAGFDAVAADGIWTDTPVSYGSFTLAEWGTGALRLVRNPAYPNPENVFPGVDQVVLRVLEGGAQAGWMALQDGTCDALDASFRLADAPELLAAIEADGGYEVRTETSRSWTQLVFGMRPAEYDALDNPVFAKRPDFFADARTRQGIAHCLDTAALAALTHTAPWPSFLPPGISSLNEGIAYNPEEGIALLDAVGWLDHDGDPSTPRLAQDVLTVFSGIPLSLTLLVGPSPFHQDLAAGIAQSLTACGVGVEVTTLSPAELYAPGPGGPLFGRQFDLALIAWQPLSGPDCGLYTSWAIPDAGNGWLGTNIAGFTNEGYDAACSAAALALPDEADARLAAAEAAFIEALPSIPLAAPPVVEVWAAER
jgi:peptide/nickel transport system substrate-binding protein